MKISEDLLARFREAIERGNSAENDPPEDRYSEEENIITLLEVLEIVQSSVADAHMHAIRPSEQDRAECIKHLKETMDLLRPLSITA